MTTLKLTQIGNSVGLILPKELLARLKLEKGVNLPGAALDVPALVRLVHRTGSVVALRSDSQSSL